MEINDFPNYLIYKDGKVWSKKSNKFLKPQKERGYFRVGLYNGGKKQIFKKIHRLVAIHYIPNFENKKEVDHIDRDKTNNRIENLRWATRQEQNENRGIMKNNKSGHKYIGWNNHSKRWVVRFHGKNKIQKYFKNKNDAIWFKFYYLLKINYSN
jgi:hypothetical protein